ncbi:MAG: YeeE/YedE thiosulfate transporter family protein [Myxococcales bacterium]|nr:YeeE/YedE thiosulfate transporter family protein [Polyangiaceae bacterium]MDW8249518.1 YeeE/YedE thiosulfate transporter family protein [Myxococcales bacterium]
MTNFTPLPALIGGILIGLSASLLLLSHGKIAGISGILGGLLTRGTPDRGYRLWFLAGLLAAGGALAILRPSSFPSTPSSPFWLVALAGLLVGYGTRLGSGCTSGHGVCGISRLSARSITATMIFMATGALTVFVSRHLLHLGGGQ